MTTPTFRALALILPLLGATPAFAHGGHAEGLAAGLAHPLLGADHLMAMLAIGAWAALGGLTRAWVVPASFLGGMAAGIALGVALPLPGGMEQGVAATVLVLGLLVALALPLRAPVAMALAAGFGVLHGTVHGAEIGGAAGLTALGMLAASGALHAVGFGLGRVAVARMALMRAGGAGVAATGIALLLLG